MRQIHRAGEKLFIDYSGKTVAVINAITGEIVPAQIFIAAMGASKYTYAEATWTQSMPDWIASHVRMFEYLGCVPEILTPDFVTGNKIANHSRRDYAEPLKGAPVASQPGHHRLVENKLDILMTRETQGHHERPGASQLPASRIQQHWAGTEIRVFEGMLASRGSAALCGAIIFRGMSPTQWMLRSSNLSMQRRRRQGGDVLMTCSAKQKTRGRPSWL
jgi:hypothetical protein